MRSERNKARLLPLSAEASLHHRSPSLTPFHAFFVRLFSRAKSSAIDFEEAARALLMLIRKSIGKALMRRSALAARACRASTTYSPYEQTLLHGWHSVQSRGGRRQLRHCTSTCLFRYLRMFSAVRIQANAVTVRKRGAYCGHRMRVTEEEAASGGGDGRGREREEKTIEDTGRPQSACTRCAHPFALRSETPVK